MTVEVRHQTTLGMSDDIAAFLSWTEINTYVFAYVSFYWYFSNRDQALRYIVDECRETPTDTIAEILEQHRVDQSWRATAEQIAREAALEEQLDELRGELANTLAALVRARERIQELEAQ
jgi:hypothetical protein